MSKYEYEAHEPVKKFKRYPWLICKYCGLVYLSNEETRKAIKLGCNWRDKC